MTVNGNQGKPGARYSDVCCPENPVIILVPSEKHPPMYLQNRDVKKLRSAFWIRKRCLDVGCVYLLNIRHENTLPVVDCRFAILVTE